jgi:hypothetical protein
MEEKAAQNNARWCASDAAITDQLCFFISCVAVWSPAAAGRLLGIVSGAISERTDWAVAR